VLNVEPENRSSNGERARPGRSFPRPRGKHRTLGKVPDFPGLSYAKRLDTRAYPATPGAGVLLNFGFRVECFQLFTLPRRSRRSKAGPAFRFPLLLFSHCLNPAPAYDAVESACSKKLIEDQKPGEKTILTLALE
jgi:hypothetical protein